MTSIQEQNRKKGGRPPTGRVRKLSKSVTVKFSKPSYEALRLRARKANRKLAEYIRESALNGEVVSGHNTETVAIAKNLIGMANNLNPGSVFGSDVYIKRDDLQMKTVSFLLSYSIYVF